MQNTYQTDFALWASEQAHLLKSGLLDQLDLENLADEIASMGKSEHNALASRLEVLLCHLLKWHYQAERRGSSWRLTIQEQRRRIKKLLKNSPSLKSDLSDDEFCADVLYYARVAAARETYLAMETFPETYIWSMDDILNDAFFPD